MGLRTYIENCMRSKDIGGFPHAVLYPLSVLYGLGVRLRLFLYRAGVLRTKRLPCPVISIGNITVGGTGKTPVTMLVAGLLSAEGGNPPEGGSKKVVVLSRGYGRNTKGIAVVSDGKDVLCGPEEAGDEPYLMATRLKGIPVVVGADRYKAGVFAMEKFSPSVIVLDDAFQHVKLHRDINILLVDSKDGFGNGYLTPRGVLREPACGATRADIVMSKGAGRAVSLEDAFQGNPAPVFNFSYKARCLMDLRSGEETGLELLAGKNVVAVSGIAGPESFISTLKGINARITASLAYPDHHNYTEKDVRDIAAACPSGGLIVTTEKDGVKLKRLALKDIPVYAVCVAASVDDARGFEKAILRLMPKGVIPPEGSKPPGGS